MNIKKHIEEVIYLVAMFCFFYEGLYLLVRVEHFDLWLKYLPFMHGAHRQVSYLLPLTEMAVAILIIWPKTRNAGLILGLVGCVCFVVYLLLILLFTDTFVLPFHRYWKFMKWFHKMLIIVNMSWILFGLLIVNKNRGIFNEKYRKIGHV
ncbi:hypothetical protein LQ567_16175 [Niabella pedocola]|uniref:Methylamine utilisation protein MauE domain-containing protein n=1 Tax=Niabella pedocola TaxID=1752077 RepID=A0ABS8PTC5_9BACT|nr:MauE/DoxX family redox-associated membrane protein [Niabella pedocola]MCD2424317.1 hypothetical protein [Niabella pedocola]